MKWKKIIKDTAEALRMNSEETEWFINKRIVNLIAAIPFLAKCRNPERTALSHLASYVLSIRAATKPYADCVKSDNSVGSISERIKTISYFEDGNQDIIDRGMNLLILNMISGYERDKEDDKLSAKYNPINDGILDFTNEKDRIIKDIKSVNSKDMDGIITIEQAQREWWRA